MPMLGCWDDYTTPGGRLHRRMTGKPPKIKRSTPYSGHF
jgi:hypothetical protein